MIPAHSPELPHWMPFVNTSGQVIPGGAVLEPAGGYDSAGRMLVRQCTVSNSYAIYFASPMGCDADSGGEAVDDKPGGVCRPAWPMTAAAVAPADLASYTYPVSAGSKAGDWYLRLGQTGFRFVDPLMDGLANAIPTPVAPTVPTSGSGSSGSGASGSGGGSGTFRGYVYRDICVNGILQQWRAEEWSDHMTPYVYLMDNGCCGCGPTPISGSGSSGSSGSGGGTLPPVTTAYQACCARSLSATMIATISGGYGSITMTWTPSLPAPYNAYGTSGWLGTKTICGGTFGLALVGVNNSSGTICTLINDTSAISGGYTANLFSSPSCGSPFTISATVMNGSSISGCPGLNGQSITIVEM